MRSALVAALVALPALAHAGPSITAGAALGITQSKVDSQQDPNHTVALFGRFGVARHLGVQVELAKIQTDNSDVQIRSLGALLAIDLGRSPHLVPLVLLGIGYDNASPTYGESTEAHRLEAGVGLEYRADGGFTVGADLRLGDRTIDSQPVYDAYPATGGGGIALYAPSTLSDGEYRSARLYLAVRF